MEEVKGTEIREDAGEDARENAKNRELFRSE